MHRSYPKPSIIVLGLLFAALIPSFASGGVVPDVSSRRLFDHDGVIFVLADGQYFFTQLGRRVKSGEHIDADDAINGLMSDLVREHCRQDPCDLRVWLSGDQAPKRPDRVQPAHLAKSILMRREGNDIIRVSGPNDEVSGEIVGRMSGEPLPIEVPDVGPVTDGPFGLVMGTSLAELTAELGEPAPAATPGFFTLPEVPRPHSKLDTYVVRVSPSHGLCLVRAVSAPITTSGHGIELRSAFKNLEVQLAKAYGEPDTRTDRVLEGSLWDEPDEFVMGLLKKERQLQTAWNAADGEALKDGVVEILLNGSAERTDTGRVDVQYRFANYEACAAELSAEDVDAL